MSIGWTRKNFPYGKTTTINPGREHAVFQTSRKA